MTAGAGRAAGAARPFDLDSIHRTDGSWKISYDIWNSNNPVPEM